MSVYLCISIDCECDKGPGWRIKKPLAFSGVVEGIRNRLQPLFRGFGAKPTYLFSAEVMRDEQAREAISSLDGSAELGSHLHGEFVEPDATEPDATNAFQCHYGFEIEQLKLRNLTDLFRSTFGYPPRSFRAGRFGIGRHSLGLLQELGYVVDSSVTPHKDWAKAGAPEASFLTAPSQPYWPVPDKPACVSGQTGKLLEVPVTIRPSVFAGVPGIGRWMEPRWLRPTRTSANRLIKIAQDEIAHASPTNRPIILNCMFHNVEIVPGASPYAKDEAEAKTILQRLAGLLAWAKREGVGSIGLGDVPELFTRCDKPGRRIPDPV